MKHTLFTLTLLAALFFSPAANGQDIIDEDFIADLQKQAVSLWSEADADFDNNIIPARWGDESAIVMGYKKYLAFDREGYFLRKKKDLEILEKRRFKIKLMDNNSVRTFSTLYFRYASKKDGFGVKVRKADGTLQDVPLGKAVAIEDKDDVPEFFKGTLDRQVSKRDEYYKVPVSNLQPGDILEYVSVTFNVKDVTPRNSMMFYQGSAAFLFDDQYELCNKAYPVMLNKIVVETDQNTFLSSRSLNGAPEFKVSKNGSNDVFTWVDRDRERLKDINFLNEYTTIPLLKFSLTYASNFSPKALFIGEAGQLKNKFDENEIVIKAKAILKSVKKATITYYSPTYLQNFSFTVNSVTKEVWASLKEDNEDELEGEDFLQIVHAALCSRLNPAASDKFFVCVMANLLEKKNIPYDILVTTPNNLTQPGDIISENELVWLIKTGNHFILRPSGTSLIDDIYPEYAGNTAYKVTDDENGSVTKITIPAMKGGQNTFNESYIVDFNTDTEKYTVKNTVTEKGFYTMAARQNIGTLGTRAVFYYFPCNAQMKKKRSKGKEMTYAEYLTANNTNFKRELKKAMDLRKDEYQNEFGKDLVYDTLLLNSYGNCSAAPEFSYTEKFSFKKKQRKAGKKILLNLPAIIGSQLHIKDDERQRQYDANVRFPRNLGFTVNFAVPEGFTLEGLKSLETNIDNEAGNFICTTSLANDTATIKILKSYKLLEVPKEKWPLLVAFTDAAYNFTQKLVLLKPKE
jgi:hypothetical protein